MKTEINVKEVEKTVSFPYYTIETAGQMPSGPKWATMRRQEVSRN
jgi:hypothetical protein